MRRQLLKSKIHRATVTARDPDYVGSITLDPELMELADILACEQVHVWDIANGQRFVTYAIEGERGSGAVEVNGAAALLVEEGDLVIVASFASYEDAEAAEHEPAVVHVDEANRAVTANARADLLHGSRLASGAEPGGAG
jgi:aspartate 1-decarboxylase